MVFLIEIFLDKNSMNVFLHKTYTHYNTNCLYRNKTALGDVCFLNYQR